MEERPNGDEEEEEKEEESVMLVFLACLVAAVFLAVATPSARAEFSFSREGRDDFLTMPPDRTVPLRDLWAAVGGLAGGAGGRRLDEEEADGGMVIVGLGAEGGVVVVRSSCSESSSSPWSVIAEGVSTRWGSIPTGWMTGGRLSMRKGEGEKALLEK